MISTKHRLKIWNAYDIYTALRATKITKFILNFIHVVKFFGVFWHFWQIDSIFEWEMYYGSKLMTYCIWFSLLSVYDTSYFYYWCLCGIDIICISDFKSMVIFVALNLFLCIIKMVDEFLITGYNKIFVSIIFNFFKSPFLPLRTSFCLLINNLC
jgi:hypothetical protein